MKCADIHVSDDRLSLISHLAFLETAAVVRENSCVLFFNWNLVIKIISSYALASKEEFNRIYYFNFKNN